MKQVPAPAFSNTIPDMAGPINHASFPMDEFRAIALGKSSFLFTISFTIDCLAGKSNALIIPSTMLSASISQTVYRVKITSMASSEAWIMEAICVIIVTL